MAGPFSLFFSVFEAVGYGLFLLCVVHAFRSGRNSLFPVFLLFAVLFFLALFGNLDNLFRFRKDSLSGCFYRTSGFYAAYILVSSLNMPLWLKVPSTASLTSLPEVITLTRRGLLSGCFSLPWFSHSGWMFLMLWVSLFVYFGVWAYKKCGCNELLGYIYPWLLPVLCTYLTFLPGSRRFLTLFIRYQIVHYHLIPTVYTISVILLPLFVIRTRRTDPVPG